MLYLVKYFESFQEIQETLGKLKKMVCNRYTMILKLL